MSNFRGLPERMIFLEPNVELEIDTIVRTIDRSDPLWYQLVTHCIRKLLQTKYNSVVEKRILFGVDETRNQVYLGTFEHWGNGVVLFVPTDGYKSFLAFARSHRSTSARLRVNGYGFTTARNEFDNAIVTLDLVDWLKTPEHPDASIGSLTMSDEGGETKLSIPEQQNRELFDWFANIL